MKLAPMRLYFIMIASVYCLLGVRAKSRGRFLPSHLTNYKGEPGEITTTVPLTRATVFIGYGGLCGNSLEGGATIPKRDRNESSRMPDNVSSRQMPSPQVNVVNDEIFSKVPVIVRLAITYDASFRGEFGEDFPILRKFVKNLILSLQMVFEQPDIIRTVRYKFVVVSLRQQSYDLLPSTDASEILYKFQGSSDALGKNETDINLLMTFRSIFKKEDPTKKLLGLAYQDRFCDDRGFKAGAVVIHCQGFTLYHALAHEIAHSLGVQHDVDECSDGRSIMSPHLGENKFFWSNCSMKWFLNHLQIPVVRSCVLDRNRLSSFRLVSPEFDFERVENRSPGPGELYTIDSQCKYALDRPFISSMAKKDRNGPDFSSTCATLFCNINNTNYDLDIPVGPALPGSWCRKQSLRGVCVNNECKVA